MLDSLRRARPLLGTFVEVSVQQSPGQNADAVIDEAFEAIATVHRLMSFHDADSDVSRLNREASARAVEVHAWTFQVLEAAAELHHRSNGVFDMTVAPILQRMGLLPPDVDDSAGLIVTPTTNLVELLPGGRVRFQHPGVRIDCGGIAKGFAVDRAIEILQSRGVGDGLVNAGGDLAAFGAAPHDVYIRDPRDPARLLWRVDLKDAALASSGSRFDPFDSSEPSAPAVIDPRTQLPATEIVGASVCAQSCMIADALTKIVMLAGEASTALLSHYGASALMVDRHGEVRATSDWQGAVNLAA